MFGCELTSFEEENEEQNLVALEPVQPVYRHEGERVNSIDNDRKQAYENDDAPIEIESYDTRVA